VIASPASQIVLVVEDDPTLLCAVQAILRHGGYSPIAASGPLEALNKSHEFAGEIHLLLTDIIMPDMDGLALAQHILAERPHIRVLLMSAFANVSSRLPFLSKPFGMAQLLKEVANVMAGPSPLPSDIFAGKQSA